VAAVHKRVGLLDLTGFAKYDISGRDAESFLNRVCANRIPRKAGGIALVHTLSPQGRILGEMTVTRLADDRFYALSAAAAELRDRDWLTQSLRPGEAVQIDERDRGARRAGSFGSALARAARPLDRCADLATRRFPGFVRARSASPGTTCGRCA
jgi:glycine cleavage system aminomethyltransferase T